MVREELLVASSPDSMECGDAAAPSTSGPCVCRLHSLSFINEQNINRSQCRCRNYLQQAIYSVEREDNQQLDDTVNFTMADADEDAMPRMGTGGEDTDLSDETQDFRFLSIIS